MPWPVALGRTKLQLGGGGAVARGWCSRAAKLAAASASGRWKERALGDGHMLIAWRVRHCKACGV